MSALIGSSCDSVVMYFLSIVYFIGISTIITDKLTPTLTSTSSFIASTFIPYVVNIFALNSGKELCIKH